jgi:hypothetical protein
LDLETNIPDENREIGIKNIIENYCIPVLIKLSSINGIKELYKERSEIIIKIPIIH